MTNQVPTPPSLKQILTTTLSLSNYQGDKEAYAQKFLKLCGEEILDRLFQTIPAKNQKKASEELKHVKTQEETQKILTKYIQNKNIQKISKQVLQEFFGEIITKVSPTLPPDQKTKLEKYFITLTKGA